MARENGETGGGDHPLVWGPEAIRAALQLPVVVPQPYGDDGARQERWRAAVVALLTPHPEQGVSVLLTRRTPHLYHHPGQISFPGGRVEEGESVEEAALREAEEEVGLAAERVAILGALPDYLTVTGYRVAPLIAWSDTVGELRPDPFEVAEVFFAPLARFADPANYLRLSLTYEGVRRSYWAAPWRHYFIWGATAAMLRALALRLAAYRARVATSSG
ncbi:NUDIX hydrolase [Hydrogenophilus islandicus]|jgi:8-oxo-dGTP pyrophosphatase MutT (NUDIX family)